MKFGTCSPFISDENLEKIITICIARNVSDYEGEIYVGDYRRTSSVEIEKYLNNRNLDVRYF